jgi:hypothetical protein
MVRLADCVYNPAGYEIWKAAWRRALEFNQSLAAVERQRQPLEDVPLSPVDDEDVILYAPPETSRGVRGDTYDWVPDMCGVYHTEGGTESDYTDTGIPSRWSDKKKYESDTSNTWYLNRHTHISRIYRT